jgi:hypothetical protein
MPAKSGRANFELVVLLSLAAARCATKLPYRDLDLPGASVCSFRQDHPQHPCLYWALARLASIRRAKRSPPEAAEAALRVVVVTLASLAFLPLLAAHD